MSSVIDYLKWRGDMTFDACPFGEVDNLIFSLLSYIDFDGIVPEEQAAEGVTVREAAKEYFFRYPDESSTGARRLGLIVPPEILTVFRQMAESDRYGGLLLRGFVNEICEEHEMQFSAVTVVLPGDSLYVAFRGTDDTLVGWKEDFNLSYMDAVPSQRKAAAYLNAVPLSDTTKLYVGGHSKGGNLAVWGAVHADDVIRRAIMRVYSNDGPGFSAAVLSSDAYRELAQRMTFLVPPAALVGLLLDNAGTYEVVKSGAKNGLFQHNPMTWEVLGGKFVRAEGLSPKGVHTDTVTRARIDGMTADEKRTLINLFFDLLQGTGAKTLTELYDGRMKHSLNIIRAIGDMDKETKEATRYLINKFFDHRSGETNKRRNLSGASGKPSLRASQQVTVELMMPVYIKKIKNIINNFSENT